MTTLEERAPLFFLTPTEREELHDLLAKAERIARDLSDTYRAAQRIVTATTDLDPHVDLGDPLAFYRLPSGTVGYSEEESRWVAAGDWIQCRHGDDGRWEQVVGVVHATSQTGLTTATADGTTRLRWWGHLDLVRVATPAVDVVAAQERKAEAGR